MHVLTILAIAGLVAATDTQHVHRACVRVLKQGAGTPHFLPPLPAGGAWLGRHICAPKLNGVVPGRWRVGGQPPAQEDLVVGKGALGVNDGSLRHCWKRQWRGQSGLGAGLAWRAGRTRESSGSRGVSVGEGELGRRPIDAQGRDGQARAQGRRREAASPAQGGKRPLCKAGSAALTLASGRSLPLSGPQLHPLSDEAIRPGRTLLSMTLFIL